MGVLAMAPDQRLKWLAKVLQGLQQGRVQASSIYDVVSAPRFVSGISENAGVKMYRLLYAHLEHFSSRQRKFLEIDCRLAVDFRRKALASDGKTDTSTRRRSRSSDDSQAGAGRRSKLRRTDSTRTRRNNSRIISLWARLK